MGVIHDEDRDCRANKVTEDEATGHNQVGF